MAKSKTAREKLAQAKAPKKVRLDANFAGVKKGQLMYVATPQIVDAYIRDLPKGVTKTIQELRDDLASREKCAGTCPMSMAFFLRTVAEAALEEMEDGTPVEKITPFWRVLSSDDKVTKRLPIDPAWVDHQRLAEAH